MTTEHAAFALMELGSVMMDKQNDEGCLACEPGLYEHFTGWISFRGTDAWVEDACFSLNGLVLDPWFIDFYSGTVVSGKTVQMCFRDGTWRNGVFMHGIFVGGDWKDGFFSSGTWINGRWHGGQWHCGHDEIGDMHLNDPTHWLKKFQEKAKPGVSSIMQKVKDMIEHELCNG